LVIEIAKERGFELTMNSLVVRSEQALASFNPWLPGAPKDRRFQLDADSLKSACGCQLIYD
jgi:hypothetical protein